MQWTDLLTAFCLYMILEGIIPFIAPQRFKEFLKSIENVPESSIRTMGLIMMMLGLISLYFIRN